jgi:gliding motility-associated-like protein
LFNTGGVIGTATIPGGAYTLTLGQGQVSNSGIDIDSCGNVYVGSINEVVKYDANLNQITTYPTSSNFNVYDVQVSPNGNIIAAGSTGNDNSGARTGYVETFAAGACATIAIVCCDATICPVAPVCSSAAPFTLSATTAGGIWSGTGITNTSNGTFSPAVSGVGTFTVYYTLPCGKDSQTVTVSNCSAMTVCRNANGTLTVSGGTAPYTWSEWDSTGQTCVGGIVLFGICTGTWEPIYGWTQFATGTTVTVPAGIDTIKVSDGGATDTIYNPATVALCVTCNMTVAAGTQTNVNCFGASTGVGRITVTGGTSPFTYTWSAGGSTKDSATGLAAGIYTVTVHDAGGCTGTATLTITQPAAAVSATSTTVANGCIGNTGKIVYTASGGTPGYTYIWSPNVSTVDSATGLAAGTYHVTITDSKGCTFTTSAIVDTAAAVTVSGTQTNVNCYGDSTGEITVIVPGDTGQYIFTWSHNISRQDSATGLAAGTYTVTVHEANGCTGTATFTITQPSAPISTTNTTVPTTCANSNGRIVITAAGGTPGYTYTWSPNISTVDSAINLAVGTYNVTVKDSKGCTYATSATVISTSNFSVSPGLQKNVSCFGGNTGAAYVTVSGGTTPYTYTWSPNVSTNDSAVNLIAGTYTVTVHDAGGCSGTSSFTITQPSAAVSASSVIVPATCTSSTGKVTFTTVGGTPAYTYMWSPNVSTVDSAKNLSAGTYQVTITDSKGCTFTTSANVGTTGGITVSPGPQTNVNCFGSATGVAHVTVTGGTTPYTFTWSPNVSTLDSAVGLAAGTYTVTVHDVNGCSGTASFTITQPATALSATNTTVSTTCGNSNGRIVITAAGGTPGYTYTWSPNVSTVDSAVNLAVGTYNVTVKDSKGCTFATSGTVISSSGFSVSPGIQRNVLCFGGNNGAAYVTVIGGTTPYTYTWSPNVSSVDSAVNLTAGTYTVTVHDAGGCSGTSSFTITQPSAAVSATSITVPATCTSNTGEVIFTTAGGTPGYTYIWSPNVSTIDSAKNLSAGTYQVTITDSKGCTFTTSANVGTTGGITVSPGPQTNVNCFGLSSGVAHVTVTGGTSPYIYTWSPNVSTTDSATGLAAGTYAVTVRDANGCTGTASFTITQPATALSGSSTTVATTCGNNNGRVVISASGGTPGYTYTWSPNVSSVDSAINLVAGIYVVLVTDSKGCTFPVSTSVNASSGLTVSPGLQRNILCFGENTGAAFVTVTGGTTPYTYVWSPNVSVLDSAVNLTAGTYTVTVHDAGGCSGTSSFTISQPSSALAATQTVTPAYCGNNNGKVKITPSGGTAGYTYTWSPNVSANDSAINLASGTYLVTVTDANQCTTTVSASVLPITGPTLSLLSEQDVSCNGGSNGKIFVNVAGGTAPILYTWSPAVGTNDSAVGLSQGTYSVTVKDANNCSSTLSVTVNQPALLSVSTTTVLANCGVSNGSATAIATGGVNPLSYQWSVGTSTTAVDSGLPAGSYIVTVTDANHCTALATATISNIGAPTATITNQVNVNCHGSSTGKIVIGVSGGTLPYGYTWSPNVSTLDSAVNLAAGTYIITVNDALNCIAVVSATITQPIALSAGVQSVNADCGQSDGWAKITVNGGAGSYTYVWSVPQTTDSITGLAGGTYYVTVTDSLGCPLVDSVIVGTNSGPVTPTIMAGGPLIFCQGGSVTLTSSATTGNTWSTGATTQSITVTSSGTFTVTQTVGSCTSAPSASVTVVANPIPPAPTIVASGPLSFCQGGSVTLTSSAISGNLWSDNETSQSIVVSAEGTYTVSDTQAGCPSPASAPVTVSIISAPSVVINASQTSLCPGSGSTDTLDATTALASAYLWSSGSTQPTITITAPGTYKVTVTVNGCVGYDSIIINTQPLLGILSLPDSFFVCQGDTVTIDATTLNATSYLWTGEINATTPVITADSEGVYYVKVSNNCGSLNTSTIVSFKDCDCRVVMPNAFTPNGDGKNDYFMPEFDCADPKSLVIRIYDRWGEKVFETNELNGQWDGTYKGAVQPSGVYMYYVEFVGYANNTEKNYKLMGTLTLIR